MQIAVVSSPGSGVEPHWSHDVTARLAAAMVERGADVCWFAALHGGEPVPAAPADVELVSLRRPRATALARVARSNADIELERTLTDWLRVRPGVPVVHVGIGGGGSPNIPWIADRLGSPVLACLRGAELVCHRGNLVDRDGVTCAVWNDAERCRWCCSTGAFSKARANAFRNRTDLFAAGLQAAMAVVVPTTGDVPFVVAHGVHEARIRVAGDDLAAALADRLCDAGAADDRRQR